VVGTGGVGTCCNLRDGTTKHSKRSFWSCHNSKFINGIVRLVWPNHFYIFHLQTLYKKVTCKE